MRNKKYFVTSLKNQLFVTYLKKNYRNIMKTGDMKLHE